MAQIFSSDIEETSSDCYDNDELASLVAVRDGCQRSDIASVNVCYAPRSRRQARTIVRCRY